MPYKQRILGPCVYIPWVPEGGVLFFQFKPNLCLRPLLPLLYHWLPASPSQILSLSTFIIFFLQKTWLIYTFHFYFNPIRKDIILFINWTTRDVLLSYSCQDGCQCCRKSCCFQNDPWWWWVKYLWFLGIIGFWEIGGKLWEEEEDGV